MNKDRLKLNMNSEAQTLSRMVLLVPALGILALAQSAYSTSVILDGTPAAPRERISLNAGWRFTRSDPAGVGEQLGYPNLKDWLLPAGAELVNGAAVKARPAGNPGGDISYAQSGFDDSHWRRLNLPHDWGIEGPFKQEYPGETGKLPWWGVGWYRKHLADPAADAGRSDLFWMWTARWPTRRSG